MWPTLGEGELLVELSTQREACPSRSGTVNPAGDPVQAESAAPHAQQQHQTPAPWAVTSNHNKTAAVRQRTLICSIYYQPGARLSTKTLKSSNPENSPFCI